MFRLSGMSKRKKRFSQLSGGNETKLARLILSHRGFTFIEVMIVLALFAVISTSLFSSFIMGMKVWKRAAAFSLSQRKALLGLERLSTELRRAYNYPSIGFFGQKGGIEFANIWQDKILDISYNYSSQEMSVSRLSRSRQEILGLEEESQPRQVIPNVKEFNLGFYGYDNISGNFTFLDSWNYTVSGIPTAVKVSLTLEDGKALEKIITIPIAQY